MYSFSFSGTIVMDPETSFYRLKEDMKKKWFKDSRDKVVITSYSEFVQNFYDDFKKSSIPRTSCSLEDSKRLRVEKLLSKHSRDPKDHVVAEELEEYAPEVNEVLNIIFNVLNKRARKSIIMIDELIHEANGKTSLNFSQWAEFQKINFIWSFRPVSDIKHGNRGKMKKEENQHFQTLGEIHRNSENILKFLDWYQITHLFKGPLANWPIGRKLGANEPFKISSQNMKRPLPKGDEKYLQGMVHWIQLPEGKEAATNLKVTIEHLEQCLNDIGNGAIPYFSLIMQVETKSIKRIIRSEIYKLPNLKGVYDLNSFEGSEDDVIVYLGPFFYLEQAVITRARKHLILVTCPLDFYLDKKDQKTHGFLKLNKEEKRITDQLKEECKTKAFIRKVT